MKTSTLERVNVMSIVLLAVTLILLILVFISSDQSLFGNIGWHELTSVGWVT